MVLGQVVYLSPDCTVEQAKLKSGSTIKVLPVKAVNEVDYSKWDHIGSSSDEEEGEGEAEDAKRNGDLPGSGASCGGGLSDFKEEIWRGRHEVMRRWNSHMQAVAQTAGGIGRTGGQGAPGKPQLLCRADMVHYLDVGGWWDAAECECCFDQVVRLVAERALTMHSLDHFRSLLHTQQPRCTPLAHLDVVNRGVLEYSFQVPAFGKQEEEDEDPLAQFMCKCTLAPFVCAEVMMLEWMAEPRVGVLMNLGKIRSRLPAILATRLPPATSLPAASYAAAAAAVDFGPWSCCWRCSSCWAMYRRAVSFAGFLVLVARWPRIDTLWKAHDDAYNGVYPALVAQLGAGRQENPDCAASTLVQVLGVKESADLKEGFGFFVQHVLSGGLEKAHAEGKGGDGGEAAREVQGEGKGRWEGVGECTVEHRGSFGGMDQMAGGGKRGERRFVRGLVGVSHGDDDGRHAGEEAAKTEEVKGVASRCGRIGKDLKCREHLKGREWERYVDGVAWILKHGGGEGREFRCSHCNEEGSSSSRSNSSSSSSNSINSSCSRKEGIDIPKGMYVSGVGATDFALAFASVFSRPEHCKLGAMFFTGYKSTTTSIVEDAAIEEARGGLTKLGLAAGMEGGGATGGGLESAASAAPATRRPGTKAAAASAGARLTLGSSSGSTSSSGSLNSCTKGSRESCLVPRGKFLPMRHPLRDLPNLLLRFGAVPPPLDGSSRVAEWEEWPEGNEAAVKFPDDASARCFGQGRSNGSLGRKNRGHASKRHGKSLKAPTKEAPPFPSECYPIVRCKADVDFIVEFAGMISEAPACAQCSACINRFVSLGPVVALIANFAYRPAASLLDCFLSVFPPHTEEFRTLLMRLGINSRYNPFSAAGSSLHGLLEWVDLQPVSFLLIVALLCPTPLLKQFWTEGERNLSTGGESNRAKGKAGGKRAGSRDCGEGWERREGGEGGDGEGDSGVVWEEVQAWLTAVRPVDGVEGGGAACNGSHSREEDMNARVKDITEMYERAMVPRFCEDKKQWTEALKTRCISSSSSGKRKGKKGEEPTYLKAWPGGVNLLACLREMLLGEPCYRPASPAAPSVPAVSPTAAVRNSPTATPSSDGAIIVASPSAAAAAVPKANTTLNAEGSGPPSSGGHACGAVGCGMVESGGVKLRSCSGCGKVAYCSRECQKAHWPSHKLTCPGRSNGKKSGTTINKPHPSPNPDSSHNLPSSYTPTPVTPTQPPTPLIPNTPLILPPSRASHTLHYS
ncbi:unnamed protein product [Closterium sp. Naga37s-1]|nr:unnamed protein product [Closterium sp. Naga37s-1]